MKLTTTTLLVSGLAAQQAAATFGGWDRHAPSFTTPYGANNECTDKQKGGYGWSDLPTGNFDSYDDFNFKGGWKCSNSFGKRDALTKRTFNSKCVKNTVSKETPASFECNKGGFSVEEMQVSVEFNCKLKFQYGMEDGSTCEHVTSCEQGGSIVKNTQCGGAKTVNVYLHDNDEGKDSCEIGLHHIGFNCDSTPPTYSSSSVTIPSSTACAPGAYGANCESSSIATPTPTACAPGMYGDKCESSSSTEAVPTPSSTVCAPGAYGANCESISSTEVVPTPSSTVCAPGAYGANCESSSSTEVATTPTSSSTEVVPTPSSTVCAPGAYGANCESSSSTEVSPTPSSSSTEVAPTPSSTVCAPGAYGANCESSSSSEVAPTPSSSSTEALPTPSSTVCGPGAYGASCESTSSAEVPSSSVEVPSSSAEVPSSTVVYPGSTSSAEVPYSTPASSSESAGVPTGYTGAPSSSTELSPVASSSSSEVVPAPSSSAITPPPSSNCPSLLPKCLNTWITANTQCKDNTDFSCYCKNADFTKNVIDCVTAWGGDDSAIQAALSYLTGICAPFIPQNPGIITNCPSTVTLTVPVATPAETPASTLLTITAAPSTTLAPGYSAPSSAATPVAPGYTPPATTITLVATVTVPCSSAGSVIIGSSTTTLTTSIVTVPQVAFTTESSVNGAITTSPVVNLAPGTPAPVYASTTQTFGTIVTAAPTNGTLVSPTISQFTGGAARATALPMAIGAAMVLFIL